MSIVSGNSQKCPSFAGVENQLQTAKLSETTLSVLTEAIVNLEPSTIFVTSDPNSDEARAAVKSLEELYRECRKTNIFRPCLDAIMGLIGQNNSHG